MVIREPHNKTETRAPQRPNTARPKKADTLDPRDLLDPKLVQAQKLSRSDAAAMLHKQFPGLTLSQISAVKIQQMSPIQGKCNGGAQAWNNHPSPKYWDDILQPATEAANAFAYPYRTTGENLKQLKEVAEINNQTSQNLPITNTNFIVGAKTIRPNGTFSYSLKECLKNNRSSIASSLNHIYEGTVDGNHFYGLVFKANSQAVPALGIITNPNGRRFFVKYQVNYINFKYNAEPAAVFEIPKKLDSQTKLQWFPLLEDERNSKDFGLMEFLYRNIEALRVSQTNEAQNTRTKALVELTNSFYSTEDTHQKLGNLDNTNSDLETLEDVYLADLNQQSFDAYQHLIFRDEFKLYAGDFNGYKIIARVFPIKPNHLIIDHAIIKSPDGKNYAVKFRSKDPDNQMPSSIALLDSEGSFDIEHILSKKSINKELISALAVYDQAYADMLANGQKSRYKPVVKSKRKTTKRKVIPVAPSKLKFKLDKDHQYLSHNSEAGYSHQELANMKNHVAAFSEDNVGDFRYLKKTRVGFHKVNVYTKTLDIAGDKYTFYGTLNDQNKPLGLAMIEFDGKFNPNPITYFVDFAQSRSLLHGQINTMFVFKKGFSNELYEYKQQGRGSFASLGEIEDLAHAVALHKYNRSLKTTYRPKQWSRDQEIRPKLTQYFQAAKSALDAGIRFHGQATIKFEKLSRANCHHRPFESYYKLSNYPNNLVLVDFRTTPVAGANKMIVKHAGGIEPVSILTVEGTGKNAKYEEFILDPKATNPEISLENAKNLINIVDKHKQEKAAIQLSPPKDFSIKVEEPSFPTYDQRYSKVEFLDRTGDANHHAETKGYQHSMSWHRMQREHHIDPSRELAAKFSEYAVMNRTTRFKTAINFEPLAYLRKGHAKLSLELPAGQVLDINNRSLAEDLRNVLSSLELESNLIFAKITIPKTGEEFTGFIRQSNIGGEEFNIPIFGLIKSKPGPKQIKTFASFRKLQGNDVVVNTTACIDDQKLDQEIDFYPAYGLPEDSPELQKDKSAIAAKYYSAEDHKSAIDALEKTLAYSKSNYDPPPIIDDVANKELAEKLAFNLLHAKTNHKNFTQLLSLTAPGTDNRVNHELANFLDRNGSEAEETKRFLSQYKNNLGSEFYVSKIGDNKCFAIMNHPAKPGDELFPVLAVIVTPDNKAVYLRFRKGKAANHQSKPVVETAIVKNFDARAEILANDEIYSLNSHINTTNLRKLFNTLNVHRLAYEHIVKDAAYSS